MQWPENTLYIMTACLILFANTALVACQSTVPSTVLYSTTAAGPVVSHVTTTNTTSSDTSEGFAWYLILIIVLGSLLIILAIAWTTISIRFPHGVFFMGNQPPQADYRVIRIPLLRGGGC